MSKRRLERELEEFRPMLEELSPDERLELFLESAAADREGWLEELRETCPRRRYQTADNTYAERERVALLYCHHALYNLHTTLLSFELGRQCQDMWWVLDFHSDETPSDETLEEAAERAEDLCRLFRNLSTQYHAYERFAEDVLGVSLETWLGNHQDGRRVLEAVRETLADESWTRLATEDLNESGVEPGDDSWVTLEEVAALRYEGLRMMWEEAVPDL